MHNSIYEPAEDSFFISEYLKKHVPLLLKENPNMNIFEMGCGSGINLKTLSDVGVKKKNIFSCDVNSKAVEKCKKMGYNCVKSNLFEKTAKRRKYDLIFFNPPYLPKDNREPKESAIATTAGENGNEIIIDFLNQAKNHLNTNGKIIIITSSLSEGIDFEDLGYQFQEISRKFLFYEKLFLWELKRIV